ncbi:unnamed protein product [Arabidopsis lyrata]|nr:unnamed protein product [Arabidopsis lyrata]
MLLLRRPNATLRVSPPRLRWKLGLFSTGDLRRCR